MALASSPWTMSRRFRREESEAEHEPDRDAPSAAVQSGEVGLDHLILVFVQTGGGAVRRPCRSRKAIHTARKARPLYRK
jgi:hypothetical protein